MTRSIQDSVIVITGASSGIGRATALEAARQGASVVLAARREEALQKLASECNMLKGQAIAVPTDVTSEEAVRDLARRAISTYGRIDVWINDAAVTLFAKFEEAPLDVFRRVFDTNVFGYVHGARAALPYFREQGSGILINVDSVVGKAPQPYTSAYVMSKHAVRAMADYLRMELILDKANDIHVCTVMPATIDTPLFQHAANYTGRKAKAMNPVYPSQKVAEAIVSLVERPQREIVVGEAGYLMMAQHGLTPELYEKTMAQQIDRDHLQDAPAPPTEGNLFEPIEGEQASVSGGWDHTSDIAQTVIKMAKQAAQKLRLPG
jgi:NAD(P)-dependent dehydrogenase (short-subunit alcohol dehydrogenase family)